MTCGRVMGSYSIYDFRVSAIPAIMASKTSAVYICFFRSADKDDQKNTQNAFDQGPGAELSIIAILFFAILQPEKEGDAWNEAYDTRQYE